ncbi:daxx-like protein isoform X2 [Maniola jurtina]|uniref:daxx-like protein isoform X2 n=1 Tax=Maniola jurtina TaxID=191418 RepID=UPI001E68F0A0|nr:daxx-like protein isoform X2 [Maniola jurtina]
MASEDVIELGSSDDEAEPAPKKKKTTPNAMVHIPTKLPGVTIKPTKSAPSSINKGLLAKPIVINTSKLKVTPINRVKPKATSQVIMVPIQNKIVRNDLKSVPSVKNKTAINPLSIVQNLSKTQVAVKKLPSIVTVKKTKEIQGQKMLTKLPPSITIKPVHSANVTINPIQKAGASGIHKRRIVGPKLKPPREMTTVEIDDEDTLESAKASPQWYLRPEDQKEKAVKEDNYDSSMKVNKSSKEPSMEEKNNKEPDTTKYVEITIEDSPLKPPVLSKHPDIGKELTITIEDSPVKPSAKAIKDVESDSEINEVNEDKQSKKKLKYPKTYKSSKENHVVEIEIDLSEPSSVIESENKSKPASPKHIQEETEKSPKQFTGTEKVNHSKKKVVKSAVIEQAKEIIIEDDEFHPTYQKFIQMCFQLENTEDMKKIVEKKIKAYYRQCPKDYVESEEFIDMVSSKIVSMKASPDKMYLYIKDIVDELNLQRKMTKSVATREVDIKKDSYDVKYEESRYDTKKQRQIRKLEKTIKKLHRAIQKLEEQEVDFDDDEDSVYLLTERYKERMVRVHAKFCQLTNTKMPSEPRIHIEARPGRPTGPAKKLEKWINRKVPIGTPLPFPDFHDVIRCVRDANEEDKLGWTDIDVMEEARDLFTRCGKKLQRRRQENEWRIAASRISAELDPAENSLDLKKKLDENKTVAAKRETELLNKYVDRQNLLKLEAVEIGDKEAEESPVESEEEEDVVENDNSMGDKQKRKQRLKRLLHEKSKKVESKENVVSKDSDEKENNNEIKERESKDIEQENVNKETIENKRNIDENIVEMVIESMPNETKAIKDKEADSDSVKQNKENENNDSDTYKVESDIDELHLLQKLHSENEANSSTLESSDSDTPIAISDTLESDSEQENGAKTYDVISIENSSYSESEMIIDDSPKDYDTNSLNKQNVEDLVTANFEIEYSSTGIEETNKEKTVNTAAIGQVEENIFLASSDEEIKDKGTDSIEIEKMCINLRDDNISISETTVDGEAFELGNVSNDENSIPENNNALVLVEESPGAEENEETADMTQENIEDDHNSYEKTIKDCSRMAEGNKDDVDSPKDIVDIRSASDVNSVESMDLQTDNENKEDSSDRTERMDITESNCNEKSEVIKDTANSDTQNKVHSLENEFNDQSVTAETSNCDMSMEI